MKKSSKLLHQAIGQSCLERNVIRNDSEFLELTAVFVFEAGFVGFRGHFPERPILPAVVQLASIRFLTEMNLKQPVYPVSYSRTKFRGIIQPDEQVMMQVKLMREGTCWTGTFSLHKGEEERVTSGACTFSTIKRGGV